ncbi:hypothetical protein TWF730_001335 [Orbilia blumenaviensis]|uniref:Uncharacterized protein n=1 Tax=Orbilia blumenaviensis TaxID=1796055 RepID=A0AAV9UHF1_9PEZI
MASPSISPLPADFDEPDLDQLLQQIRDLTKLRNSHQAALLALRSTKSLKDHLSATSSSIKTSITPSLQISDKDLNDILLTRSAELSADKQQWTQEALYRMAGLTKFTVIDPSYSSSSVDTISDADADADADTDAESTPNAHELTGIRIEVMADGKFGTPYYLFLKPYDMTSKPTDSDPIPTPKFSKTHQTLHRHTIPAYFINDLMTLAEKYLPPPPRLQNLDRFVRDVRQFLVLHYLRRARLLHVKEEVTEQDVGSVDTVYISGFNIDPEARLVEIEWQDPHGPAVNRLGWIALTQEGGIEGLIVKEDGQRILHMEMQIKGNWVRGSTDSMDWIEGLFKRLQWSPV